MFDIFKKKSKKSDLKNEIEKLDAIQERLLKQGEKTINEYYRKQEKGL